MDYSFLLNRFPSIFESYFNKKWPKSNVEYSMRGSKKDVRTILDSTNIYIEQLGSGIAACNTDMDLRAMQCLKQIKSRIEYKRDIDRHSQPEFWQTASETWNYKTGDCEDGAILIMKTMEAAGIPAYRRKLCAGWVKSGTNRGGHAYVIYLASDLKWYVMDWCYWYNESVAAFKKKAHHERTDKYYDIWWTFNEKLTWAQHDVLMDGGLK